MNKRLWWRDVSTTSDEAHRIKVGRPDWRGGYVKLACAGAPRTYLLSRTEARRLAKLLLEAK